MSAAVETIQEYLVKLGYVTDAISEKKVTDGLGAIGKKVFGVGSAVAGLTVAVAGATAAFAYNMRKMYAASELSGSSVKNMNAMSYAASQIGISGDTMQSAIHGMAQAMRLNPGLQGLVESFGVKVQGRDMSDVAMDFVKSLKSMPEFAGAQYAQMFGIDPDTFHMMMTHMGELTKAKAKMNQIYKEVGFNPDDPKNKQAIKDLTTTLDNLEARASLVGQKLLTALVGPLKSAMTSLEMGFDRFAKIIGGFSVGKGWETWLDEQKKAFENPFGKTDKELAAEEKAKPAKEVADKKRAEQAAAQTTEDLMGGLGIEIPATTPAKYTGSKEDKESLARWMSPGTSTGQNVRLGDTSTSHAVTIHQTNSFEVHGADSKSMVKAIGEEISRNNGNATRAGIGAQMK
jgi:hypothetical protein